MTKKQTALILTLVAVLLACLSYQLLIRPMRDDYSDTTRQNDRLLEKLEEMQTKQQDYALYQAQYDELLSQSAAVTAKFMPDTAADVLDRTVTRLVEQAGLSIQSLQISPLTRCSVDVLPEDAEETQHVETGVVLRDLTYTAMGNYDALLRLRDAVQRNPALCISHMEFSLKPSEMGLDSASVHEIDANGVFSSTIVITAYMYAPPDDEPSPTGGDAT